MQKKEKDRERAREKERRERERERNKRRKRKYGQAKLKHAKRGVFSCVMAGSSMLILMILLAIAYTSGGTATSVIGGFGIIAMIFAGISLYAAIKGFKEREKDYLTCKIGLGVSIVLILFFIGIFCRGLI